MNRALLTVSVTLTAVALFGCGPKAATDGGSSTDIITETGPAEISYCSSTTTYSGGVTISGTATFQARKHLTTGDGGLGAPASPEAIRYAEVRITDSSGEIKQCAQTDGSGNFSFDLPNVNANYTVAVNARANNNYIKASILDTPTNNNVYALKATVNPSTYSSALSLNATADGDVLGGAFNIYNDILRANEFLRTQVGSCSSTYSWCPNFTVTSKISAYWMKGFNPNSYFGNDNQGLSFYLPGYSRLFILGGINGDTDSSDTDHFDNSVIIHEFGHFIEDTEIDSHDSPGGSHNGNGIIDPRLAWSEGWANFFQAAVRNDPHYIDTLGNASGTTRDQFNVDIENLPASSSTPYDYPTAYGEGNYREFSVSRVLWDFFDGGSGTYDTKTWSEGGPYTDNVDNDFIDVWATLKNTTTGFSNSHLAFRNIGDFHQFQIALQSSDSEVDASQLRGLERQRGDTHHYGQYVSTGGSCGAYSFYITPTFHLGDAGDFSTSNLYDDNDFYWLHLTSAYSGTLSLTYKDDDGSGDEADLDLFLYNESAQFGDTDDMVGYSRNGQDGIISTAEGETITLNHLPAGDYLINVNVYTGSGAGFGGKVDYTLKLGSDMLCTSTSLPTH